MTVTTRHIDSSGQPIKVGDTLVDETGGSVTVFMQNYTPRVAACSMDLFNGLSCSLNLWMIMSQSVTVKH